MSSRTEAIAAVFNKYVMPTYAPGLALVKGKGTRVWDADGKVYLDFVAGIATLNVGHCHPTVVGAIQEQAEALMHVSNLYYTENQGRLAQKLSELAYAGKGKCFFANSGAEANEAMIKLARLWGSESGRYEIVTLKKSFHGRTLATAAATGQEKVQKGFEPMLDGFVYAQLNDIESVKSALTEKSVAVMVEAVQGEGGIIPADPEFLQALRALCDERNLLLLCDEVQCGMGRTGKWFGFQHSGIEPDAFTLAKALGSGYPIGALVGSPKVADVFQPGKHASTFGGTPLACAAALATIEVIESEELLERATVAGNWFKKKLEALATKYEHVTDVRGCGFMVGLVLDTDPSDICKRLIEAGVLCIPTAGTLVRFLPPLNVTDAQLEEALEFIEEVFDAWHGIEPIED
jgi:predicted acetylornithine/succinylornithine family transaminase